MSDPLAIPSAASTPLKGPFRLAVALVAVTIVVIVMGAMTTSTGSGLAYADWPLSDGQLMPESSYTTLPGFLEHFHRLTAASAGLLSLTLMVWLLRWPGMDRDVRRLAVLGLCLIVVQGVIGGTGVLKQLPLANSAAHGTLAQITIAVFAITAYRLSPRWQATVPTAHPSASTARTLAVVAVAALVLQTVFGAIARHSPPGAGQHALWTHVGNAFVVFLVVLISSGFAAGRLGAIPGLQGIGKALLGLLVLQILLGFVALLVRTGKHPENIEYLWRASLISSHVLVGALQTLFASLQAAHVFRGSRPR